MIGWCGTASRISFAGFHSIRGLVGARSRRDAYFYNLLCVASGVLYYRHTMFMTTSFVRKVAFSLVVTPIALSNLFRQAGSIIVVHQSSSKTRQIYITSTQLLLSLTSTAAGSTYLPVCEHEWFNDMRAGGMTTRRSAAVVEEKTPRYNSVVHAVVVRAIGFRIPLVSPIAPQQ